MKVGDKVIISPDLTHTDEWTAGTVIEVEDNPFVGIVISAETPDGNVFFGREDLFKPQTSAFVANLGTDLGLPPDFDEKEAYRQHLADKYQ